MAARERPGLPVAVRWMFAIVCPIAALVAKQASPSGRFPTPFLLMAVMISAHFGGMRPAILAFGLSFGLLDYFYIPPFRSLVIDEDSAAALAQFIVPAALGVWFIEKPKDVELLLARETALTKRLQGAQTPAELGRSILDYLAPELGAPIAEPVAVAVRTARYRDRLQTLLDETRRQVEAIKAQDEELRAANEELEERGQAMLESQRKLEEQQAELEQTNATLQDQARLLEQHNQDLARAQDAVRIKSGTAERANRTAGREPARVAGGWSTRGSIVLRRMAIGERR